MNEYMHLLIDVNLIQKMTRLKLYFQYLFLLKNIANIIYII